MKRFVLIILSALFITSTAAAASPVEDLSPWQGDYISRITLIQHPEMQPLYRQIAEEAAAQGKSYTIEEVKTHLARTFQTDFSRIKIKGNSITFYFADEASQPLSRTYKYAGEIPDSYGKMKFSWHGFTASAKGAKDAPYTALLLMKTHKHNKGVPHFHLRYSSKGLKVITGPKVEHWWPTLLPKGVDIKAFRKGMDSKLLVKLLP